MENIKFRLANIDDAKELLKIYEYYVLETSITFEYDVPTLENFKNRIKTISAKYPYIVALVDNKIVGYAYAHEFYGRRAYMWSVEETIYLDHSYRGKGIGKSLLLKLEEALKLMGVLNINSCITYVESNDKYVTDKSYKFHTYMGYNKVGIFHKAGYKFNTWYDVIWLEKIIGDHHTNMNDIKYINEINLDL